MKKIIKIASIILVICGLLCLCTACGKGRVETNVSFTYTVETGDKIEIKLNTTDGYGFKSELPFSITKENNTISQGTFITEDGYRQYKSLISLGTEQGITVIEPETTKDGLTYIFYTVNGSSGVEYNYVIMVDGSKTGLLIGSLASQEQARDVFEHLTISIVE